MIQDCQLPNDEDAYLARWLIGISTHQLNYICWVFRNFFSSDDFGVAASFWFHFDSILISSLMASEMIRERWATVTYCNTKQQKAGTVCKRRCALQLLYESRRALDTVRLAERV